MEGHREKGSMVFLVTCQPANWGNLAKRTPRIIKQGRARQMPGEECKWRGWDNRIRHHNKLSGTSPGHSISGYPIEGKRKNQGPGTKTVPVPSPPPPGSSIFFLSPLVSTHSGIGFKNTFSKWNKTTDLSLQSALSQFYPNVQVPVRNLMVLTEGVCYIKSRCEESPQRLLMGTVRTEQKPTGTSQKAHSTHLPKDRAW